MSLPAALLDVEVPASLSNLGPGLDTLGMALELTNRFTFSALPAGVFSVDGVSIDPSENLVIATSLRASAHFKIPMPVGLSLKTVERLPRARGLGSSSTARIAGLLAFQSATGASIPEHKLLSFLAHEEGHPDNVLPGFLGGLITSAQAGEEIIHRALPLGASLEIALCIPEREVPTQAARAVLPDEAPRASAVFNLQRLALLVAGLIQGDLEAIRAGVADRLHQPFRAPLIGPAMEAIEQASRLGAAAFISGSGSTLAAIVGPGGRAEQVAAAMASPLRIAGIGCEIATTKPSPMGFRVLTEEKS